MGNCTHLCWIHCGNLILSNNWRQSTIIYLHINKQFEIICSIYISSFLEGKHPRPHTHTPKYTNTQIQIMTQRKTVKHNEKKNTYLPNTEWSIFFWLQSKCEIDFSIQPKTKRKYSIFHQTEHSHIHIHNKHTHNFTPEQVNHMCKSIILKRSFITTLNRLLRNRKTREN